MKVVRNTAGQSSCGRSDSSALEFGCQLDSLAYTYTVDYVLKYCPRSVLKFSPQKPTTNFSILDVSPFPTQAHPETPYLSYWQQAYCRNIYDAMTKNAPNTSVETSNTETTQQNLA